jgi:hypothetical protein
MRPTIAPEAAIRRQLDLLSRAALVAACMALGCLAVLATAIGAAATVLLGTAVLRMAGIA